MIKFAFKLAQLLEDPRKLILTWTLFYYPLWIHFFQTYKRQTIPFYNINDLHGAFEKASFDQIPFLKTRKLPKWLGLAGIYSQGGT